MAQDCRKRHPKASKKTPSDAKRIPVSRSRHTRESHEPLQESKHHITQHPEKLFVGLAYHAFPGLLGPRRL
eukprot:5578020-Pyramimonas_sp.AAC.1